MKHFFIIGAPKSGTTLIARLMDSHPEIACTTELFPFHMKGGKRKLNPNWKEKLRDHGFEIQDYITTGKFLKNKKLDNTSAFLSIKTLLDNFAERCNASIIGDKFPWYIGFIDDMLEMFPNAHYIYNVRDPRAVWNSAKNFTRPGRADSLLKLMLNYDKKIQPYLTDKHFQFIKFEDLFIDNFRLHYLYNHVGANTDTSAIHLELMEKIGLPKPLYPERFKGIPNSLEALDESICTKWKTQMSQKEINRVTKMSKDFIRKYGYGE